jgi:hypothetical protein
MSIKYKVVPLPEDSKDDSRFENNDIRQDTVLLESKWRIFLTFPIIIVSTIASSILLYSSRRRWFVSDIYYDGIVENRAAVQVVVQLLAGLCGVGQVSTVRNLINYAVRLKLTRCATTLDRLNLYTSLTTAHINWSLPPLGLATLLGTTVIALAPTALWVGALTPIVDFFDIESPLIIATPAYTNKTEDLWKGTSWYTARDTIIVKHYPEGIFTYGPIRDHFSYFLDSGATASKADGGPPLVRKTDNSNYTYYGRSYGVGSSVGILDKPIQQRNLRMSRYSFEETGYIISWSCAYNRSTKGLTEVGNGEFFATNPQHGGENYYVDLSGDSQIVSSQSWSALPPDRKSSLKCSSTQREQRITIVTTDAYKAFNATQCHAFSTPTRFFVDVDVTNRIMSVVPKKSTDIEDIDCTGIQSDRAMDALSALSMVSTTSYTSAIGNMLQNNLYSVLQQPRRLNETDEQMTLRSITETLEALSDQYLSSNAGAQLMIGNDTEPAEVKVTTRAFRIGQSGFIYAVFVTNLAVLILVMMEAFRTGLWHGLPKLNFADMKSVMIAGAFDGRELWRITTDGYSSFGGRWAGEANSRITGAIKVRLVAVQEGVGLKAM